MRSYIAPALYADFKYFKDKYPQEFELDAQENGVNFCSVPDPKDEEEEGNENTNDASEEEQFDE